MKAMTRKRDRFFAGFGAMLFLVTASAFTILIIITMVSEKDTSAPDTTATEQTACEQTSVDGTVEAAPEVYKAPGTVTELESTDIKEGDGQTVKAGDCIQVKYYGTLAQSGTLFDENYTKAQLLQSSIGVGQLIAGWDEGVIGMKVGGERRLVVPAEKGYGASGSGEQIPPNSDLVFMIKLVAIKQP